MCSEKRVKCLLAMFIALSMIIKLLMILKYKNQLTLASDDINYVKSAVALLKNRIFTYHNFNEPTVFITPLYPFFLAVIFKIFGYGLAGFQAARIIQAILSCITIVFVFKIAKELLDARVAVIASFMVAFYLPNITAAGYFLTETLFAGLLYALIYFSLKMSKDLNIKNSLFLGCLWAVTTLCRPTIALYPVLLFMHVLLYHRTAVLRLIKPGIIMLAAFSIIMLPWWIRNYMEYGEFIPLAASSGNPMLQGTYINYEQTPQNIVYYKMGKNYYETDKNELETARYRIITEFKRDFLGYLKWYTLGKTYLFWGTAFYWKSFFGINAVYAYTQHYILLIGFIGIMILIWESGNFRGFRKANSEMEVESFFKYFLPISIILYFNIVHCVYMAFDRYAFPVMPTLSIFSAFFIVRMYSWLKKLIFRQI